MATYLLFCTAEISTETLNRLMRSQEHNFYSLVRNPEQTTFDDPTEPPVEPYTNGFIDWTSERIREFVQQRLPEPIEDTNLEPGRYAILDKKSEKSDNVILGHSYSPLLQRDPDTMTEEEREEWEEACDNYDFDNPTDTQWAEWRCKFNEADDVSTVLCFEQDFTPKLYNTNYVSAYTTSDGVLKYEEAFQNYVREQEGEEEQEGEDE